MILKSDLLAILLGEIRNQGKTVVFTNGCFDILHSGHVKYLTEARKLGDALVIGLNSDDSVRRLKGPSRPVNSEGDRAYVLDSLKPVDFVVMFDEDTPLEIISQLCPDVLVKGGDYTEDTIVGAEFVKARGGRVLTIPLVEGKSTSSVIEKLSGGK